MTQELTSPTRARQAPAPDRGPQWWRDAVIYQVYVRSFADSDGDGIGDLRGVRRRLPYLKSLGVDAVWLTPFYASPQADGGYDVADYRAVDPLFGSLQDADDLIRTAHEAGLRVIVDIVPNHTSDRHPWFMDPDLARERYVFRPGKGTRGELPPNDWESVFGGPAWTRTDRGDWYLHLFAPEQPDLDWDNPEVHAEFAAIMRFWLDLGVDGFRIDVAHGMVKAPGLPDIGRGRQATLIGTRPTTTCRPTSTCSPTSCSPPPGSSGTRSRTGRARAKSAGTTFSTGREGEYLGIGCAAHGHTDGRRVVERAHARALHRARSPAGTSAEAGSRRSTRRPRAEEAFVLALRTRAGGAGAEAAAATWSTSSRRGGFVAPATAGSCSPRTAGSSRPM